MLYEKNVIIPPTLHSQTAQTAEDVSRQVYELDITGFVAVVK